MSDGSHDFRAVLRASGVDEAFIDVIQLFYPNNVHILNVRGEFHKGVEVRSGGCPLSWLLFAMCVDVLPRRMREVQREPEDIGAFANNISATACDYRVALLVLGAFSKSSSKFQGHSSV